MSVRTRIPSIAVGLLLCGLSELVAQSSRTPVTDRQWHLGRLDEAEWSEPGYRPPDAHRLELAFSGRENWSELTLFIRQDDVRHDWAVELNGRRLGRLFLMEADLVTTLPVPPGALRDGTNQLVVIPPAQVDDIVVGEMWLKPGGTGEAIAESWLNVQVIEEPGGHAIPARITIVDSKGTLVPLTGASNQTPPRFAAVRPGVAYIGTGVASIGLPAGDFTVYASRGFEHGVQTRPIHLGAGETMTLKLAIASEVPTDGWVSCDPHVHTLTHSGHGDATIDERMLTIAGEGIELPIATDHNYHADYRESAARMGVGGVFTPVTGNEVTTGTAHFNIFPVQPSARIVDFRIGGDPALAAAIRATPGVKVVVLNHPLNVHNGFQPFAPTNFNNVTGEHLGGPRFSFDAIELLSSSAQQSDFMAVFRGWFALLNHGHRITGVGSSDCHDVSRYIVGQSRTYLAAADSEPGGIDVLRACDSLLAGRALVSMGLLVNLKVDDTYGVGDLATNLGEQFEVVARVLGPSWVEATNVVLYANGQPVFHRVLADNAGRAGEKAVVRWQLPRPPHDVHLVAVATGPGITAPYWAIPRPYQPTSKRWIGRVIGATNPVWLDADGDGRFTAARDYARLLIERNHEASSTAITLLAGFDEAVAAQLASLLDAANVDLNGEQVRLLLEKSSASARRGFESYAEARAASRR